MAAERFSKVLVVEDNEPERRLLADILREESFEVIGCESACEALDRVQQHSFGVAIVDLRLPDLSGTQLLERIRALDEEVRVIIYTGAASFDSVKEALNLGAFAYVEKLSDPSELLRHVHRARHERADRYATDLEEAVAARTTELARSNRELEAFASVVAHDLRSPLLTISGYCQILQDEHGQGNIADANEYLGYIVDGVARMNRLIGDLLDYARVGRSDEPFEPVALDVVLTQVLANLEAVIRQSQAHVHVGPLPVVLGDQTQLVQLFQNLIVNAIKFHRDADPVVEIAATREESLWQFSVADNGIGIRPEHFEQIFQVFHRLHGKEYPGTGIGLALCKKIVERHGGRIWLESQPGQGTTFFFTLRSEKAEKH
jgi:light-regulated signal transduction histidine kinase (bacteriophytochrome)